MYIILKCMSSKLEDRYSTCEELLQIIDPRPDPASATSTVNTLNNITEVTRRSIFDYLIDRYTDDLKCYVVGDLPPYQEPERVFIYHGRRTEVQFLEKLYDLDTIGVPWSESLRDEITRHTVRNDDYPYGWVFEDNRFCLLTGDDDTFLRFIALIFHPLIRSEKSDWQSALEEINQLLEQDRYELYESERISGKAVYSYRMKS